MFGLTSKAKMEKTSIGILIRQKVISRFFGFGLHTGSNIIRDWTIFATKKKMVDRTYPKISLPRQ